MKQRLHMPLLLVLSVVGLFCLLSGFQDIFFMADSYVAGSDGRFLWMLVKMAIGIAIMATVLKQQKASTS